MSDSTNRLSPQHRADLHASGLTDATIATAGFRSSYDPVEIGRILNWQFPAKSLGPCLVIPFRSMTTGELNGFSRIKPTSPLIDDGKARKYEQPKHAPSRSYVTASAFAATADPSIPLAITEGEKKSLSIEQTGIASIGLTGVSMWSKRRLKDKHGKSIGQRELNDDLAAFVWRGRTVYITFDTDSRRNPDVNREAGALALCLMRHGARVIIVYMPIGPTDPSHPNEIPVKTGVDDYIVRNGAEQFLGLLDFAVEADGRDQHH